MTAFCSIIIPLCIALCAVWFSHWISNKREYGKAKASVKAEINVNIKLCSENLSVIDQDLNYEKINKINYEPFLPFCDLAWNTCKGSFLLRDGQIVEEIEDLYGFINFGNRLLQRMEDRKWFVGRVQPFSGLRIAEENVRNLNKAKAFISSQLLPLLIKANESLSKGIKNEATP